VYDNTLIVVTADHGDAFLEHGDLQHGRSLYRELVHVPLLVRGPGLKGGRHITHVVENASIAPTVLEATGADSSPRSFYPALVAGTEPPGDVGMSEAPTTGLYALREGPLKLITSKRGTELYDLKADPGERHNLAATRPKDVARLQAMLKERLDARVVGKTTTGKLTEKQRKVMKSLGYLK
jgi:arylsulfatase A-like enzyme